MSNARKLADLLDSSGDVKGLNLDNVDDILGLEAYNNTSTITGNAVDIFIYDTSKDSDGGAWRKRTQATSWYNEASSTTRGSRKDFPAVAVIVAESNKVTIYDGDTPDLDMWMVIDSSNTGATWSSDITNSNFDMFALGGTAAVAMMNGILVGGGGSSAITANFINERSVYRGATSNTDGVYLGTIAERAANKGHGAEDDLGLIVNASCNDVAMTVLPNAPIDSATGLPTPTIAVATNGGVSVIKDDGTVANFNDNSGVRASYEVSLGNNILSMYNATNGSIQNFNDYSGKTGLTLDEWKYGYNIVSTGTVYTTTENITALSCSASNPRWTDIIRTAGGEQLWAGSTAGLNSVIDTPGAVAGTIGFDGSSVAYITSKYNTGYMTGDIRGSWNVDTDVTTLGTELVTNGTFTTDSDWVKNSHWTISGGTATMPSTGSYLPLYQYGIGKTVGRAYTATVEVTSLTNPLKFGVANSTGGGIGVTEYIIISTTGTHSFTYIAANSLDGIGIARYNTTAGCTITSISIKEAIPDRSVKGNGLAVHGTPTVSAVATGAELKCVSGNAQSDTYFSIPWSTSLIDLTSDWSLMFWGDVPVSGTNAIILVDDDISSQSGYNKTHLKVAYDSSGLFFRSKNGNLSGASSTAIKGWTLISVIYKSGVVSVYANEDLHSTLTGTINITNPTASASLKVCADTYATNLSSTNGKTALVRISATAPTAEQILEIYEAEKPLFQENAKCTLNGTSDAVTAMDYDDSNEELLVGTSTNLSVFKGLRRVDENTNNITEVAQQGGLRVEEY